MYGRLCVNGFLLVAVVFVDGMWAGIELKLGAMSAPMSGAGPKEAGKVTKGLLATALKCSKVSKEELEGYLRVYFAEQVAADVANWPEAAARRYNTPEYLSELVRKIADVEAVDFESVTFDKYEIFKKQLGVEAIDSFLLRECSCVLSRKKSLLRENAEKYVMGALDHVAAGKTVRIVDIGSGNLLPLLTLMNSIAQKGYKNIAVSAIDNDYESLIAGYQKLRGTSFDIGKKSEQELFLENYSDENGPISHDTIAYWWLNPIHDHLSAPCEPSDEAAEPSSSDAAQACGHYQDFLSRVAEDYRLNHMMRAFLRWAHQFGINLTFKVYANVDDYLKDGAKTEKADMVTMIDVPLRGEEAGKKVLSAFKKVKDRVLAPSGKAVFFGRIGAKEGLPEEGEDPSQAIFYVKSDGSRTDVSVVDTQGVLYKKPDAGHEKLVNEFSTLFSTAVRTAAKRPGH